MSFFSGLNLTEFQNEFAFSGRNPYQERLIFESKSKPEKIAAAKTLGFMMGFRGTNVLKILSKTRNIKKWKDALKILEIQDSERTAQIKIATMYPEMIAIGQCSANRYAISPFIKFNNVSYNEWVFRTQAFMKLTKQPEHTQKTFVQVSKTVWNGVTQFWDVLSGSEREYLQKNLQQAMEFEIFDTSEVKVETADPSSFSRAAQRYNDKLQGRDPDDDYRGFSQGAANTGFGSPSLSFKAISEKPSEERKE